MAPGLVVDLNGLGLAAISSDGLNVMSVRVAGDRVSEEFAHLDITGGLYVEGADRKHLIWETEGFLNGGDEISVALLEAVTTSRPGQTIEQLYGDERQSPPQTQSIEEVFQELARRPIVRDGFTFKITQSSGEIIRVATFPNDHGFAFSAVWNWLHPERALVSLSSNTLDGIARRQGGSRLAGFQLQYGDWVRLRID